MAIDPKEISFGRWAGCPQEFSDFRRFQLTIEVRKLGKIEIFPLPVIPIFEHVVDELRNLVEQEVEATTLISVANFMFMAFITQPDECAIFKT